MPTENIDTGTANPLMTESEAKGRVRQWVRDIREAQDDFRKRLLLVANMTGARAGVKMRRIERLAEKFLAPAFVLSRHTIQGCELYFLDTNEKSQLVLVKVIVDHHGETEWLVMNFCLSLHFIARVLQYYRVRDSNPIKHSKVLALLRGIPQVDGDTINTKILVHDEDGVVAEICCAVENLDDGKCILTATTFIVSESLYPERYKSAEKERQHMQKRGFKKGKPGTEVL